MKYIYIPLLVIGAFTAGHYTSFSRDDHNIIEHVADKQRVPSRYGNASRADSTKRDAERPISAGGLSKINFSELENIPRGDRYAVIHHLLMKQIKSDPAVAYHWMLDNKDRFDKEDFSNFKSDILTAWGHSHPESANGILSTLDTLEDRDSLTRALAKGWADKNVHLAFNWLENINEDSVSDNVLISSYAIIMRKYAEVDPIATANIVANTKSESLQYDLLHSTVTEYAKKDHAEALNWALSLENIELRNAGINELLLTVKESNRLHLLKKIVDEESKLSTGVLTEAFSSLATLTPVKAAERVFDLPTDKQPAVTSALVTSWAEVDLGAAETWVSSLSEGVLFESGVESIVDIISYKKPIEALVWAEKISGANKRLELMSNVINSASDTALSNIQSYLGSTNINSAELIPLNTMITNRLAGSNAVLAIPDTDLAQ